MLYVLHFQGFKPFVYCSACWSYILYNSMCTFLISSNNEYIVEFKMDIDREINRIFIVLWSPHRATAHFLVLVSTVQYSSSYGLFSKGHWCERQRSLPWGSRRHCIQASERQRNKNRKKRTWQVYCFQKYFPIFLSLFFIRLIFLND